MPSGLRKTTGNHFEIYYEQPWGGVASDKDPVDIADNELVTQQGVIDVDGTLCQINFVADSTKYKFPVGTSTSPNVIITTFEISGVLYAIDYYGLIYTLETNWLYTASPPDAPWTYVDPITHKAYLQQTSAVIVINSVAYISNFLRNTLYTWDGTTYAIGSNYVAGILFGILDDYLLQLNTNTNISASDDGRQPMRINWSGPGEFTTWNPSIDRTSGFDTLASVEDRLSGFLSFANVGVAISAKGLVQLSPTGVGVAPFSFSTLWTSAIGQGCVYTYTVVQYGQYGLFLTDSGVQKVSTGGIVDASPKTRTAILNSLNLSLNNSNTTGTNISNFVATVMLYANDAAFPTPYYVLAGISTAGTTSVHPIVTVWLMNLNTGAWSEVVIDVTAAVNTQYGVTSAGGQCFGLSVNTNEFLIPNNINYNQQQYQANPITFLTITYGDLPTGTLYTVCMSPYIFNKNNTDTSGANYATPLSLVFKAQEIKLGYTRKPTIRRCVVKAYGSGTLAVSITDVTGVVTSLGNIVLDGTNNPRTYFTPSGVSTVEAPQLSITSSNFKGVIIKAMLTGTYADGDID